ncbi:hypothetical protein SprV_0501799300 [Sparganum proliferum]
MAESITNHNPRSNRPGRRTSLIARELTRYKADIAALGETRFSKRGQLDDVGAGNVFFLSGRPKAERLGSGVTFAIRNNIVGRPPCLPQGINDHLMSPRLPLRGEGNLLAEKNHLHKVYANRPTDDNKTAFCRSRRLVQQRLREMQDAWTARKAEDHQEYADHNEWKFFAAIKAIYGPTAKGTTPHLSAGGTTLHT